MDLSVGFEHRRDTYEVQAGDYASYANGGYCVAPGNCASSGAQVTNGISPDEESSASRNSLASYVDVGFNPVPDWYVGTAFRYEHYNQGVGATRSGKLTTRYDFTPQFAVRATVSNGFRAPSLANSLFSARSTTYGVVNGVYQSINYGVLPVGSAAAQALGAQALKPERSTNFSLGFTLTPTDRLSFTADAYVINLRDRITLTGTLLGPEITQVLQDNGINSTSGGQYFINGADTRTKGLDLVSNYSQDLGQYGSVKWTAAFNWNQTRILNYKESTNILGTSYELMNREARNLITGVQPNTKLILGGDWSIERLNLNLALTRYGSYKEVNSSANRDLDRIYSAKWITDLDLGYNLTKDLNIAVGAKNLFDIYPKKQGCRAAPWSAATASIRPTVLPAGTTTPA